MNSTEFASMSPRCVNKALMFLTVLICYGANAAVHAQSALGDDAIKVARALANTVAWTDQPEVRRSADKSALNSTVDTVAHPLGVQTLSVERNESKQAAKRRLTRVYQYSYPLQRSRVLLVNTAAGTVVNTRHIDSIHLPLSPAEISMARKLLASSPVMLEQMRNEQRRRGQVPFATLDELELKASIHEPLQQDHACAIERCALLSLFDSSRTVFALEPVVFLQSLSIATLQDTL